jgi:hypothetical protein
VLLNLAWSSLKSGHTLEAEHYFKQFLTEGKDITDKQRADANDGLTQSHAKLGRIEVAAAAGTEVTVDGDKAGTTPLPDPILVEPGAHTVKFKGPDGATDTDSVTVLAGEKAIARFAKTASAAPPAAAAATPPPASTDTEATPPSPPPAAETPKPAEAPPAKQTVNLSPERSLLSPPETLAPVIVGGVVVVGSAALAIVMLISKQTAQNKANDTAAQISAHGGTSCSPPSIAADATTTLDKVQTACGEYQNDNQDVNTDATIGNIALGVGVIAAVGTIVYWLVADRRGDSPTTGSIAPVVTPIVGPSVGGLSLSGNF